MIGLAVVSMTILGCAAYQYFKGTIVKAFATIIVAICASLVAFGYFEISANLLVSKLPSLKLWVQPLCFALLFILAFAILQTITAQLTRKPVDFGLLPERIGRVACGILLGLIISGILLTALAMAPLPNNYPYQRFDQRNPTAQKPNKVFLNADGFAAGWFSMVSRGSLRAIRNARSFAVLHPDFLDQIFLNRHNISDDIPLLTSTESIDVPREDGAWYAPATDIKDTDGNPITSKSGHSLVIIRMGIKINALTDAGKFTPSQLRLICKQETSTKEPLAGKGINVYPIGYISGENQIQTKKLNEIITVVREDFESQEPRKYIDFAFDVPNNFTPILLEFKLNNFVEVPRPVDQAPEAKPFVPSLKSRNDTPKTTNPPSQPRQSQTSPNKRGLSNLGRSLTDIDNDQ